MNDQERQALAATRKQLASGDIHGALESLDILIEGFPERSPGDVLSSARSVIRQRMAEALDADAARLAADWKKGEFDGSRQSFEEAIDGEAAINNTDDAAEYLHWSKNEGAFFQHHGGDCSDGDSINWCALAYYARRQDLVDVLHALGIDTSDRPPRDDEFWCEECSSVQDKEHSRDEKCKDCVEAEGNTLCTECSTWVDSSNANEDEVCMNCAPPESASEELSG